MNEIVEPQGHGGGGLALFWKQDIDLRVLSSRENIIDTQVEYEGKKFFLSLIYADTNKTLRKEFWKELTELATGREAPWYLTGDFNDILNNDEKRGGPLRAEGSFTDFRTFFSENDLYDLQHTGDPLSWRGVRYSHVVRCRLDRAIANSGWSDLFPRARCEYLKFEGSDHKPIISCFESAIKKKNGIFRFDRRLKDNEEVQNIIRKTWNEVEPQAVELRIIRVRNAIIKWHKKQNQNSREQIEKCKGALELAMTSTQNNDALLMKINLELKEAYEKEENFWKQRSRSLWLNLGDKNTSYFHAVTKGRKARNNFSVIEDANGRAVFEEDKIAVVIAEYFRKMFQSEDGDALETVRYAIQPRLSEEENQSLILTPNLEEIRAAVFSIHSDKAPGPDGFSAGFYHSNWDAIGSAIVEEIQEFFRTGRLPEAINETYIRLIPKIPGPRKVADYRPIALCNVYYKIISKILTSRMQPLLPILISETQSAFVPGRNIADNVLITHEVLHSLKTSAAKQRCSMAVKTDMSKAYDRLEWNFIREVLRRFGFHEKFVEWIMQCVSTVSYSFLINDSPRERVKPQRGIRQGDPLSPYLFILCSEVLSGLCNRAAEEGRLQGIQVAKDSPKIHHLLFADDTMFFCKTNKRNLKALKDILKRYEKASGQSINYQKSAITFSKKAHLDIKRRVKRELRIENEGGIGKYLGLPEHFGRRKKDLFTSIVDRIRQKALSWSSKFLSTAGKMTLLKSVLTAIPTYAMSCFKLPISLCKSIQSVLTRFWWDKRAEGNNMAWVSWKNMTNNKKEGGLGFRDIQSFNDAMLAKLSWRILQQPEGLMARILLGKYCKDNEFMSCIPSGNPSHGWRSILRGRDLLARNTGWVIGNGKKVRVWNDHWLSTKDQECPMGPATKESKSLLVSDLMVEGTNNWNLELIKQILPNYEMQIMNIQLSKQGATDKQIWLHHYSGEYSVKSGYTAAISERNQQNSNQNNNIQWNSDIWHQKTAPKIKLFLWKAAKGALPTAERLQNRQIIDNPACVHCGEPETILHVLFCCKFALQVWRKVPFTFPGNLAEAPNFSTAWQMVKGRLCLPPTGIAAPIAPWIVWTLWITRNQKLFNNRDFTVEDVLIKAINDAKEWNLAQSITETIRNKKRTEERTVDVDLATCRSDSAWRSDKRQAGLGWTIFSAQETVKSNHAKTVSHVSSALVAEALAMREAILTASDLGIRKIRFESDSMQLIQAITNGSSVAEMYGIVFDIAYLKRNFVFVSFKFISRVLNGEADSLAKAALWALNDVTENN